MFEQTSNSSFHNAQCSVHHKRPHQHTIHEILLWWRMFFTNFMCSQFLFVKSNANSITAQCTLCVAATRVTISWLIGLSKERPILGDHAKAHIHEIRRISTCKSYKSNNSRKTLQFYAVQWEGYVSGFHEIHRISKDQQLPGMVRPMFSLFFTQVTASTVRPEVTFDLLVFTSHRPISTFWFLPPVLDPINVNLYSAYRYPLF